MFAYYRNPVDAHSPPRTGERHTRSGVPVLHRNTPVIQPYYMRITTRPESLVAQRQKCNTSVLHTVLRV